MFKVVDQKDEEVEFYRKKFAGSQADRIVRAEAEAEKVAEQLKKTKVSGVFPHSFPCSSISNESFKRSKTISEDVVLSYIFQSMNLLRKRGNVYLKL